jgi:two-component system, OmpR family, alkaline phosphatase synthesis response regulator PhoP
MPKLIYLIEDDAGVIEVYKTGLEKIGKFEVKVFKTCKEAKDKIEEFANNKGKKPDLILLDLILPECNGVEILGILKKTEQTKDIPVIILTNYTSDEIKERGIEMGTKDYLTKTEVTPTKLAEIVKEKLKE